MEIFFILSVACYGNLGNPVSMLKMRPNVPVTLSLGLSSPDTSTPTNIDNFLEIE